MKTKYFLTSEKQLQNYHLYTLNKLYTANTIRRNKIRHHQAHVFINVFTTVRVRVL